MKTRILAATALVLAGALPALAQDDLDAALARMASSKGSAYVEARTAVLSTADARARLDRKLAGATWTDASSASLAMAAIAQGRLASPEAFARVEKLEGIDPSHYRKLRRPDPECARELVRLARQPGGTAAVLELTLKTWDARAFSDGEQGKKEREALREGAVRALASSRHPATLFVCRAIARSNDESQGARMIAVEGLGSLETDAALAEISAIHGDAATPDWLRLASIRGAAAVPTKAALTFVTARLASTDAAVRRQAVVSLGALGSAWGWDARGDAARGLADEIRRDAALELVNVIDRAVDVPADDVTGALATVAHPAAKPGLEKLSKDSSRPEAVRSLAARALASVETAISRNAR